MRFSNEFISAKMGISLELRTEDMVNVPNRPNHKVNRNDAKFTISVAHSDCGSAAVCFLDHLTLDRLFSPVTKPKRYFLLLLSRVSWLHPKGVFPQAPRYHLNA